MAQWTAKDPDAVLDYSYTIRLDAVDSIAPGDYTFTKLSGDVVIDSDSLAAAPTTDEDGVYGQVLTAWLSGGTEGETAVFRVAWVTAAGRTDDDIITLAVATNYEALLLTDYAKPSAHHLIARYPAFAAVEKSTIAYWLTDAERSVDESWTEGDYAAALMALAAHNMASAGLGTDATSTAGMPAGLTRVKSGDLDLTFSDGAAKDRISGAYGSTRYGSEFIILRRRNHAGPRVMPTGTLPYDPLRYPHGQA